MSEANREFLFSYRFGGKEWGTSVFADSPAEAKEKIKAMSLARYDGECMMTIPVHASLFGIIPRMVVWWKGRTP